MFEFSDCLCIKKSSTGTVIFKQIFLQCFLQFTVQYGLHSKQTRPILRYNFRSIWFMDWNFKISIFWKTYLLSPLDLLCPSVTFPGIFSTHYLPKSKFSRKSIQTNLGKIHRSVLGNFKFFENRAFSPQVPRNSSFERNIS